MAFFEPKNAIDDGRKAPWKAKNAIGEVGKTFDPARKPSSAVEKRPTRLPSPSATNRPRAARAPHDPQQARIRSDSSPSRPLPRHFVPMGDVRPPSKLPFGADDARNTSRANGFCASGSRSSPKCASLGYCHLFGDFTAETSKYSVKSSFRRNFFELSSFPDNQSLNGPGSV